MYPGPTQPYFGMRQSDEHFRSCLPWSELGASENLTPDPRKTRDDTCLSYCRHPSPSVSPGRRTQDRCDHQTTPKGPKRLNERMEILNLECLFFF